jgi:hypothetical protein
LSALSVSLYGISDGRRASIRRFKRPLSIRGSGNLLWHQSWATDGVNSPLAFKVRAELAALDVDFLEARSISPELPVDSTKILAFSTEDGSPSRFTCIASTKGPASPTEANWLPSHLRPKRPLRLTLRSISRVPASFDKTADRGPYFSERLPTPPNQMVGKPSQEVPSPPIAEAKKRSRGELSRVGVMISGYTHPQSGEFCLI